ncbi:hypothetical protein CAEBREN_31582 [Caenorhabditis brenneri]|uniref:Uncharacterized protein n=1 Tax=Caenorhabditis brenneri TaxID=135651 RepID=G0PFM9_CAEBE|nr:hypothetical protein CAEBREN_31582 [Caenorhabditis brenneri]
MGARLSCSCSQAECWTNDESTLRIDAELFELSQDGQKWEKLDGRLANVRVFNAFDDSQPRLLATSSSGQVLLDTLIPMGEKVHKVSDFFVYLKADGRTIGFNTLSFKDTSLLISQSTNTSAFNMFQHSFSASVSRIATFEGDSIQPCDEEPETSNVSLNPLSMIFNYKGSPVTIDLLECFACSSEAENCVDIAHANNIFRVIVSAHAHLFLIQALNVSSLLLARTTSHIVAINYLARQNEKIQQKLISLLETSESSDNASKEDIRQMLLLKNVVVTQRLNSLQQRPLPGIEVISFSFLFIHGATSQLVSIGLLRRKSCIESVHNKIEKNLFVPFFLFYSSNYYYFLLLFLFSLSILSYVFSPFKQTLSFLLSHPKNENFFPHFPLLFSRSFIL